jgi:Cyclin-dependent kinase inhibitor 3 (CDKN3)
VDRDSDQLAGAPEGFLAAPWPGERSVHGGVDEIPLPQGPGRLWLCGKHFVGDNPELALAAVDADRIVCLCEPAELAARYPLYVAWLEAGGHGQAISFPIPDLHAPAVDAALPFLDHLVALLADGRVLLMHCGAGIGRAGTMAAALLMRMGAERTVAVETVARSRPMAGPEAGAQSELLLALASRT